MILATALLAAFLCPPPTCAEPAPVDGRALFDKTRDWLRSLPSMEAGFVQVNRWVGWSEDEPDTARGTLYLQRPCCFRLEYEVPKGHEVVCDGEVLWTYVPDLEQVIRADVPEEGVGAGDLFLWLTGSAAPDSLAYPYEPPIFRLGVDPPGDIGWRWLEVLADVESGAVEGYSYEDVQGNRTSFRFTEFRAVPRRAKEAFRFEPPPGVEVVEAP